MSAIKAIAITVQPSSHPGATLLVPEGFDNGFYRPCSLKVDRCAQEVVLTADYCEQTARELWPVTPNQTVTLRYDFMPSSVPMPEQVWQRQRNRYTEASASLVGDVRETVDTSLPIQEQIRQLIEKAKDLFSYGHGDGRFYDGELAVPSVCGTTRGSCVDINTYLLAAANVLEIPAQYVAGYWFHPEKNVTHDMHCWLMFRVGEETVYWDLAHHLKWGVDTLAPGLNPAGGRRVAMSVGRGLKFATSHGECAISHFSEPVWLHPDGKVEAADLTIGVEEG